METEFTVTLTTEDYIAFSLERSSAKLNKNHIKIVLVIAMLALVISFITFYSLNQLNVGDNLHRIYVLTSSQLHYIVPGLFLSYTLWICLLILSPFGQKIVLKKFNRHYHNPVKTKYKLTNANICLTTDITQLKVSWDGIEKITESEIFIVLFIGEGNTYIIIPKKRLAPQSLTEVKELIQQKYSGEVIYL